MKTIGTVLSFIIAVLLIVPYGVNAGPSVTAKENLEKLLKTRQCRGCDLSGINFNRMDLSGVDLEGADLSSSTFFLADLSRANLQNTTLRGAKFGGADLGESDLRGADLRGASIDNAYLGDAKMTGSMVTSLPYEKAGVSGIAKDVYREDQVTPKKPDSVSDVNVRARRDLSEPPPSLGRAKVEPDVTVQEDLPEVHRPQAPKAKTISPVQEIVVEEASDTESSTGAETIKAVEEDNEPITVNKSGEKSVPEKPSNIEDSKKVDKSVTVKSLEPKKTTAQTVIPTVAPKVEAKPAKSGETKAEVKNETSADVPVLAALTKDAEALAEKKMIQDNRSKLLDKNRCYGCDLSGVDLSGKNLDGADLEKANLSKSNLTKVDLEGANLKGANLRGAILVKADLEDADFYNADLRDADLTDAKQENALFDGANLDGAKGVVTGPLLLGN